MSIQAPEYRLKRGSYFGVSPSWYQCCRRIAESAAEGLVSRVFLIDSGRPCDPGGPPRTVGRPQEEERVVANGVSGCKPEPTIVDLRQWIESASGKSPAKGDGRPTKRAPPTSSPRTKPAP